MNKLICAVFAILFSFPVFSQGENEKKWSGHGYVKLMTIETIDRFENTINQNFIHHRYNFRYDFLPNLSAKVELRNRLFYGEFLKLTDGFGKLLQNDPGYVDMSWNLIDNRNAVLHSTIDRAWLNWNNEKWDVGIGRQRINWGINLVWNPNDLFNVLNFTDFDYEERPGSDAIRVQRYLNGMTSFESAYKFTSDWRTDVGALMYKFNKNYYDIQLLAGKYQTDLVVGLGWAGNLNEAGFKGEVTYFEPALPDPFFTKRAVSATIAVDYSFRKGVYLIGSYLYNTSDKSDLSALLAIGAGGVTTSQSARKLMPNEHSLFFQGSKAINPVLSASFATIYAIDMNGILLFPTIGYSVAENMEISLVAQTFLSTNSNPKGHISSGIFLRFKYNY